ncbi:protein NEGATIVE GRAVITROPIC RESPONSE OF ROOTS-like isoform X2 [Impatiens glandulifera]|uniref:protein NEGATIVE GRAVITROPIC RESPONSE OF ROOTS-like isoform X2 n=1 Tax=Impatiens glandulifera TaxID=253017 RepID=UPI001FB0BA4F|nr:protein NEGATIVE GRAVITROPIC RESPONSE OF ROOTS-like isoform X2 [Impatiens glandulifera]
MKLFSWVHNRILNGGGGGGGSPPHHQTKKKHSSPTNSSISISDDNIRIQEQQGETHDCHSSSRFFLSIGTLGNKCPLASDALIHPEDDDDNNDTSYNLDNDNNNDNDDDDNDLSNFTLEEVGQLQKELKKLLKRKSSSKIYHHLSSDESVNFPTSILEVDHIISNKHGGGGGGEKEEAEEALDRTIKLIIDRCRDVCKESKRGKSIGKRSVSFLIKKMFMCTNGFKPSPRSFRDNAPFQESTLMDKLIRTMLSKKIHPQSSSPSPSSIKKRLEEKPSSNSESQVVETKSESGSKWVKTDSEYIVLEI